MKPYAWSGNIAMKIGILSPERTYTSTIELNTNDPLVEGEYTATVSS